MFDYLCVLISVVMIGFQFSLTKLYRGRAGTGLLSALLFNTAAGLISCLFLFLPQRFSDLGRRLYDYNGVCLRRLYLPATA